MEKKKFKKGELICKEGSPGQEMYVILEGKVNVFKTVNAEKIYLSTLERNDFFGEIRLLLGFPRTASVEAAEDTEVIVIKRENLLEKIQKNPKFAVQMLTVMAQRLTEAHSIISNLEGMKRSLEIMYKSGKKEA
ncbi:MAG: cyclic nucleotide-binding domain-containing protein [Spirochaetales bacterium]|nr:cyclic nucleotide-binding domain-containing protein [Spirochaetales bacterium]